MRPIDADALFDDICDWVGDDDVLEAITNAPTIKPENKLNLSNDDIDSIVTVITHDHCGNCNNSLDCDYPTCQCPYLLAKLALLLLKVEKTNEIN